ncbi:protein-L-isoaspartate(D-aspartate) O-methyltransferase [Asticcacaulis benevestitus]|uniref:Protein-L-isoaspartate O-methyltransferase n=1 Tax=Asticcacaulis benevestitus DSM 16100 = ATCC BAA-896 TaxID=1121022 RepID=V4Q2P0_9CAUL|nr:protein-L-isoaspartate(D-aspartate) O-methyltransferase [Asticcacaulis benevestitus]ESQ93969.1 protein-L-isoaspartate O-methyltransferase [Asticcacaulis benevestitus DSM 16100 = ATCC BAA-896]
MSETRKDSPEETRLERLLRGLKSQGIDDKKLLHAMEYTPRDLFVPELFLDRSWEDSAIPINCGQTISQPYIVALMTQALKIEGRHRVLEIGTGSGYQTAVLSRLARYVYTIERYRSLMVEAEIRHKRLMLENIIYRFGDGWEGWPEQAPFDRILVTAALPEAPTHLLAQLKVKGIMVGPQGRGSTQRLLRYTRTSDGYETEDLGEVRFVPLIAGVAKET